MTVGNVTASHAAVRWNVVNVRDRFMAKTYLYHPHNYALDETPLHRHSRSTGFSLTISFTAAKNAEIYQLSPG